LAVPNSNVDQLTAITNDYFMPDIPDLVHDQNVFFKLLRSKMRKAPGGAKIDQPLLYQFDQDGAYFDYEKMSTAAEDQVTRAEYNWKLYRQRIVISEPEMDRNSGPEAVFNLLETKTKGAGMAIRDAIGTDQYTTTNGDSVRGVNSIPNLLGDATFPSTPLISGGIDRTGGINAFFTGTNYDYVGGTLGQNDDMLQAFMGVVDGTIKPNLILSHNTPQRVYLQEVMNASSDATSRGIERFSNTEQLLAGFTVINFMGAPWVVDLHCPTTELYMLNMDFMHLVVHSKRDFVLKPFVQPEDQDVNIASIKWMGNITTSDPSRSCIMYT
jgi:hypothetical protein